MPEIEQKPRPDVDLAHLLLYAARERRVRLAKLGRDVLDQGQIGSANLLLAFISSHPSDAESFAKNLGVTLSELQDGLEQFEETKEEQAVLRPVDWMTNLNESARETIRKAREGRGDKSFMSVPLTVARRASRDAATQAGLQTFGIDYFLTALLASNCEARQAVLQLTTAEKLSGALSVLAPVSHPAEDFMANAKRSRREILEAKWPDILQKERERRIGRDGVDKLQLAREKTYAENPDFYEKPVNLAERFDRDTPPDKAYMARLGACLLAAGNEARIRRAPAVKLDHLFYALLQDGTDTHDYLSKQGIDVCGLREKLDKALPRYEEGPRWPENARDLGMHIPTEDRAPILIKDLPPDLKVGDFTPEQFKEYCVRPASTSVFTDLLWLRGIFEDEETIAYGFLTEAGLTEDSVLAEIKSRQTGDPNWFKVRPDLVKEMRETPRYCIGRSFALQRLMVKAAQFEARLRWSPTTDFEHVLLAFLVDGSDTSNLLASLEVDRVELRNSLDAILPQFATGPYFPKEEQRLFLGTTGDDNCSDLRPIEAALGGSFRKVKERPGVKMLRERGVTIDLVQTRLKELGYEPSPFVRKTTDDQIEG